MTELTIENLLLLVTFFIPGFIYLKSYRLLVADTKTDFSKEWYEALGVSIINFILFSYPIYKIFETDVLEEYPLAFFFLFVLMIIVAPVLWAFVFYKISSKKWFSRFLINPTKSAWDSHFSQRESYYVIITLKNGKIIGGKYGMNSFSSVFPQKNDIYIEELWKLNNKGGFKYRIEQTQGILITEGEISTIEFYI